MERLLKKYEQRFRKAEELHGRWNILQDQFVRLFASAAAVIQRIPLMLEDDNYGAPQELRDELVAKQAESLERVFMALRETLLEFESVCRSFEKLWKDGSGLLKNEKPRPTKQQVQLRVGSRASLQDCVRGLEDLYTMHRDEYALKSQILSSLTYDTKPSDVSALQIVLADQPNIPPDEVESIFNLIFAAANSS